MTHQVATGALDGARLHGFPLSPQQRRLWRAMSAAPSGGWRAQAVAEIAEAEGWRLLSERLQRLAAEHEILRTRFVAFPGMELPLQVVGEAAGVELREASVDAAGGADGLDALLAADRAARGDLATDPPLRAWRVAERGSGRLRLLVSAPALIADGCGLARLVDALIGAGGEAEAAAGLQYADVADWQNELLTAPETQVGRDWWQGRRRYRGPARLPGERPGEAPFQAAVHHRDVPPEVAAAVEGWCAATGRTLEAVLLAGWAGLLARWTRRAEVPLAVACDGRRYRELDGVVGPLARFLPLIASCAPSAPPDEVAERLEAELSEIRKWQESFDLDGLDAHLAPAPWAFALDRAPAAAGGRRHWEVREPFRLALTWHAGSGGAALTVTYDAARHDAADVERLAGQLLERLAAASARPLAAVPGAPLSPAERRLLAAESAGEAAADAAECVHRLFEAAAARHPERTAVEAGGRRLTYAEVERRSADVARRLAALGVAPEDRVLLLAERTPETIVGLLGILRAGAAYVPVDPDQPAERRRRLLAAASPVAAVAGRPASPIADGELPVVIVAETEPAPGAGPPPAAGADAVRPGNLAYVLFTSGSTGEPKGVAVEHRQLVAYLRAVARRLDLPEGARYAVVTTLAADLGHTMLFPALCGGTLVLPGDERGRDVEALARDLAAAPVDALKSVPGHFEALLAAGGRAALPARLLVLGGEATRRPLAAALAAASAPCRVLNHYGPTETTVGVLTAPLDGIEARWDPRWESAPLGRPLAGSRAYVVEPSGTGYAALAPLPVWVPGEICLGGAGVSRGYLGRPGATADRFVPDPFCGDPGARMYRTGDLGRRLPADGIEFLGRLDRQLKIRGFRVEPGEIEARLGEHPEVRECAVLPVTAGAPRLAAFLAPRDGRLSADECRRWLAERLPEPMVPAAWKVLPALPRGANGKVDRGALAAMDVAEPAAGEGEPPRGETEETLATIWSTLLGVERIGRRDGFFALGGHSLLATQVVSRLRETFGVDLPLHLLFDRPVLAELAAAIDDALRGRAGIAAPPLVAAPRQGDPPLSFAQQRHWFLQQLEADGALYNMRSALLLHGDLDAAALAGALARVVARHEALRTIFPTVEGRPVQRIEPRAEVRLARVDLDALPEARREPEASALTHRLGRRGFDLARGPLLRTALLRLGPRRHRLAVVLHHVVADGWSLRVLVEDAAEEYRALIEGRPSPLTPLPLQYADFAIWQRGWLRGEMLERELAYWRERLAGAPPELPLPYDRPRPPLPRRRSGRARLDVPAPLTARLRQLGRARAATPFQVLLTGYAVLLHDLTGHTDLVIGAPVANRNRLETERLIGCFINALALRCDLAGEPSFLALLSRVRRAVLEASAHQDLPFERLVEELRPDRRHGTPLFQTVFAFGDLARADVELPRLRLAALGTDSGFEAKYDLFLVMSDLGEELSGALVYARDRFDEATVAAMARRFVALLTAAAEGPERTLAELVATAREGERRQAAERSERRLRRRREGLKGLQRRGPARGAAAAAAAELDVRPAETDPRQEGAR